MDTTKESLNAEQICLIVNDGQASRILQYAKKHGINGGTIIRGMGTIRNRILEFMGLHEIHKEIVFFVAPAKVAHRVLEEINEAFALEKPNHGIAYSTAVCNIIGSKNIACAVIENQGEDVKLKYHVINIIVDNGRAEEVVKAAEAAGSKGGTVIHARGSGVHEHAKVFNMDIEPEKEMVLILSEADSTDAIIESVRQALKLDEPGNGIIFVQNALRTYGIFK